MLDLRPVVVPCLIGNGVESMHFPEQAGDGLVASVLDEVVAVLHSRGAVADEVVVLAQRQPFGQEGLGGLAFAEQKHGRHQLRCVAVGRGGEELKQVALGVLPFEMRRLKGEGAVVDRHLDPLVETRPGLRVDGAPGVGIDEDVALGHLREGLEAHLGLPDPVAVADRRALHEGVVALVEVGVQLGLVVGVHLVEEPGTLGLAADAQEGAGILGVREGCEVDFHFFLIFLFFLWGTELESEESSERFWRFKLPAEWSVGQQICIHRIVVEVDEDVDSDEQILFIFYLTGLNMHLREHPCRFTDSVNRTFDMITEPIAITVPTPSGDYPGGDLYVLCTNRPRWLIQWTPADDHSACFFTKIATDHYFNNIFLVFDDDQTKKQFILLTLVSEDPIEFDKITFGIGGSSIHVPFEAVTDNTLLFRAEQVDYSFFVVHYHSTEPANFSGFYAVTYEATQTN